MASFPATFKCAYQQQTRADYGDCAPCTVIAWLDWTSGGLLNVGIRTVFGDTSAEMKDKRVAYVERIRSLGGQNPPVAKGKGMSDAERLQAIRGGPSGNYWDARFLALGLNPPRFLAYSGQTMDGAFKTDIINGRGAIVSIMYGPIDWYPATVSGNADLPTRHTISGQWRFKDGHSVLVEPGSWSGGGTPTVTIHEPLQDGRYSGTTEADHGSVIQVVSGSQTVPWSVLKKAAGMYAGTNKVTGGTFTYATSSASSDPNIIILITAANPTHITTQAAHGLSTGATVIISGSDSTPSIDGTYVITVLDSTHFTIPLTVSGAGSAGSWSEAIGGAPPPSPCF